MRFDANEDEDKTGGGFDLIPAGKHRVTVTDHENSKTSGGYEQLVVTYTDDQGRTRKDWLICDGAARWQLSSLVHCMHAEGEKAPVFDTDRPGEVKRALYGKPLEIVVAEEEYQGRTHLKVKYRNRVKGEGVTPRTAPVRRDPPPARSAPSGGGYGGGYGTRGQFSDPGRDDAPPPADDDIPF